MLLSSGTKHLHKILDFSGQEPIILGINIKNRKLQAEVHLLGGVLEGDGFRFGGNLWMALE